MTFDLYEANVDAELWSNGDDIDSAIDSSLDSHFSSLEVPWLRFRGDWQPSKGMIVIIAGGNESKIEWSDIYGDFKDDLQAKLYDDVGESESCQDYPVDLHEQFIKWLSDTVGPIKCFNVTDITEISFVYSGSDWVKLESAT